MSSVAAAASATTTLTVDEALNNMHTTIYQETVCVACGEQIAPDELKIACLTRCKNSRLALPGCYCCGKCLKSKVHLGELDSEAGVWSCALCPKTADKFEASFLKEGVSVVKWSKQIAERRATPNELCWPAQPYTSGVAMKSLEVQLERAKTASTADKRAADHAAAKAATKIEQLNAALGTAQAAAAAASAATVDLGHPMCLERTPAEEAEDAAEAAAEDAAEAAAAREAEEAAHQERIEAQRRETERRREEAELASLAATAEERAASAAAKAAAAAAASPPDTPAGRPSPKSRFLAKEGNTEEMWLQKQADAVAKAKETRKRKADATAALEARAKRGKAALHVLRLKLERVKELARSMGASAEEIGAVASDDEEESDEEDEEEEPEEVD
jgi:hypothetical protein